MAVQPMAMEIKEALMVSLVPAYLVGRKLGQTPDRRAGTWSFFLFLSHETAFTA
jgi:hypothetical protein